MTFRLHLLLTGLTGLAVLPGAAIADSPALPPYNHYIPSILERYAERAETSGNHSTAHILQERAKRLSGNFDANPIRSNQGKLPEAAQAISPQPLIDAEQVPPLWQATTPAPSPEMKAPRP